MTPLLFGNGNRRLIAGLLAALLLASSSPPTYALRSEAKQEQTGKGAGLEELVTSLAGLEEPTDEEMERAVRALLGERQERQEALQQMRGWVLGPLEALPALKELPDVKLLRSESLESVFRELEAGISDLSSRPLAVDKAEDQLERLFRVADRLGATRWAVFEVLSPIVAELGTQMTALNNGLVRLFLRLTELYREFLSDTVVTKAAERVKRLSPSYKAEVVSRAGNLQSAFLQVQSQMAQLMQRTEHHRQFFNDLWQELKRQPAAGLEEWPGFLGPADFGRIAVWLIEQLLEGPLRERRDQITLPEVIRHIQTAAESGRDSGHLGQVSKERVTFFVEKLPFLITSQPEPPEGALPQGYELTRFFNFWVEVATAVVELWQEDKILPEMTSREMTDEVLHRFFSTALSTGPMELGSPELNLHLADLFMTPEEQRQATYRVLEVLRSPPPAAGLEEEPQLKRKAARVEKAIERLVQRLHAIEKIPLPDKFSRENWMYQYRFPNPKGGGGFSINYRWRSPPRKVKKLLGPLLQFLEDYFLHIQIPLSSHRYQVLQISGRHPRFQEVLQLLEEKTGIPHPLPIGFGRVPKPDSPVATLSGVERILVMKTTSEGQRVEQMIQEADPSLWNDRKIALVRTHLNSAQFSLNREEGPSDPHPHGRIWNGFGNLWEARQAAREVLKGSSRDQPLSKTVSIPLRRLVNAIEKLIVEMTPIDWVRLFEGDPFSAVPAVAIPRIGEIDSRKVPPQSHYRIQQVPTADEVEEKLKDWSREHVVYGFKVRRDPRLVVGVGDPHSVLAGMFLEALLRYKQRGVIPEITIHSHPKGAFASLGDFISTSSGFHRAPQVMRGHRNFIYVAPTGRILEFGVGKSLGAGSRRGIQIWIWQAGSQEPKSYYLPRTSRWHLTDLVERRFPNGRRMVYHFHNLLRRREVNKVKIQDHEGNWIRWQRGLTIASILTPGGFVRPPGLHKESARPYSTGLEQELSSLLNRTGLTATDRLEELVSELGSRARPATQGAQPMRILVDTNRLELGEGDSRVLRLAELGILLKLEAGLPIQVAGLATPEELAAGLEQLPDEVSRDLLRSRIFVYQAGDPESHETARMLLGIAFPEFEGVEPITTVDEKTVQWFLAGMEELGIPPESFTPEFKERIRSFLTVRHAA